MAIPTRSDRPGTFFVTSRTLESFPYFRTAATAALFLETLRHYRGEGYYQLHAFVVMPDHIHLLLTPTSRSIERVIGFIKGGFSHRLAADGSFWQRSFTDHRIRNEEEFLVRKQYIHQNPVRAGLVKHAEDYPYSSAYRGFAKKDVPSG